MGFYDHPDACILFQSHPFLTQTILGYNYPDIVTVQSKTQETRDLHGSRLGDYLRERGRYSKDKPVWKQQDGDHVLSYNDSKEWVVSREDNKDMAGMKTETMGSDRIPSSGWIIWVSKRWKSDKELQVLGWLIFLSFLSLSMSHPLPRKVWLM